MSDYCHAATGKNNPPAKIAAEGTAPVILKAPNELPLSLEVFDATVHRQTQQRTESGPLVGGRWTFHKAGIDRWLGQKRRTRTK